MSYSIFYDKYFLQLLPEKFFATSILLFTLFLCFNNLPSNLRYKKKVRQTACIILILTFLFVCINDYGPTLIYQQLMVFDSLTYSIKLITLLSTIIFLWVIDKNKKVFSFEFIVLILCLTLSLLFLISSNDFLILYLALELQSLIVYILVTDNPLVISNNKSVTSSEEGVKYFVLGFVSSAFLVFGIYLLYGQAKTTDLSDLRILFNDSNSIPRFLAEKFLVGEKLLWGERIVIAITWIMIGFFFKLFAFPYHMWIPDVCESGLTSLIMYYAVVPKLTMFGIWVKLAFNIFNVFNEFDSFIFGVVFIFFLSMIFPVYCVSVLVVKSSK